MLTKGPARKVTIFVNETAQYHMQPLHDAILAFLMHKGVSGATATRAQLAAWIEYAQRHRAVPRSGSSRPGPRPTCTG